MKRILPILLVLMVLVALLASCTPKDEPVTTAEQFTVEEQTTGEESTVTTTTRGKLGMGIDDADKGWSFWGDL